MSPNRPARTLRTRALGALAAASAALLLLGACSDSGSDSGSDGGTQGGATTTEPTAAATGSPTTPASAEDCTDAGQVWLVVAAEDGSPLADECVGTPATGTAALEAAGLDVTRDASGFICAIGGEPARCPASFDGKFWQYYTATPGGEWAFASVGSDEAVPAPGSIEGWCYGESCTPPEVAGVTAPTATPSS